MLFHLEIRKKIVRACSTVLLLVLLVTAPSARGAVIISEIFYNLNGSESAFEEWIEITNTGTTTVDLENWTYEDIQDGVATNPFPSGTTLAAGASAVLVEQPASTFQNIWGAGVNVINISPGISLANGASATNEIVAIRNNLGIIVDEVNYENGSNSWPGDANGASIYLLPGAFDVLANDLGSNWATSVAGVDGAYDALIVNPDIDGVPSGTPASVPDVASPGVAVVIPEPTSIVLLAAGLGLTMLAKRRRFFEHS